MRFTKHYFPPTRNFIFIGRFWFDEAFYSYVATKYCLVCTVHDLVHIFNINKITTILTTCYTKHFHTPTTYRKPNKLIMVTKRPPMNNIDDPHHCTNWWKLGEFETTNVIASSFSYTLKTTKRQPGWNHCCCYFIYVVLWTPKLLMSLIHWREVKTCN
jgi:hypothetical protein